MRGTYDKDKEFEASSSPDFRATGFLYGYPGLIEHGSEHGDLRLWLVTCAHVVKCIKNSDEYNAMLVRMNKSGRYETTSFGIPLFEPGEVEWIIHPDKDVAVIKGSPKILEAVGVEWEAYQSGASALVKTQIADKGIVEGEEVLMAGFPTGWREGRNDYPIVRKGVLAQIQGWLNDDHDTFLVDGSGFPGNSGGPVIIRMVYFNESKTEMKNMFSLIGMVSKASSHPISGKEYGFAESADLIEVIPVDAIDETIQMAMAKEGSEEGG